MSPPLEDIGFDAFGRDPAFIDKVAPSLNWLIDRVFRLKLQGAEHLPDGPFILVANHAGALPWDSVVLTTTLSRPEHGGRVIRPLIEDEVMTVPFLGMSMARLGCVRASRNNAARLLERGEPVAVFPEGAQGISKGLKDRYRLRRFGRGGFIRLAIAHEVPLVPIAVLGPADTSPLLAKLPVRFGRTHVPYVPLTPALLPARWAAQILPPVTAHGRVAFDDRVAVAELADRVRDQIQEALDELVELRPRVFDLF